MGELHKRVKKSPYRTYLLTLLSVIFAFNLVDRLALGIVLQNIKSAFALTDTKLGLLSGIAFAAFYATVGIPLGRWADRGNRVTIIGLTCCLWTTMVMLTGAARSFAQLLFIRMGAAVGEAGCMPPAYSLIADYFSRDERPQAMANYLLGASLSVIVGYFVAGWLNQAYGWRLTFLFLGLPGLILAPLAWLTLRDPRATATRKRRTAVGGQNLRAIREVSRSLWNNRTFRRVLAMQCVNNLFGYGLLQWQPAFFIRSYGMSTKAVGFWFAIIYGVCGFVGTYFGGYFARRWAPADESLQLRALAVLNTLFAVISALAYLSGNLHASLALIGISALGVSLENGPILATIQTVIPDRLRATSLSVVHLFANLIGMGVGPLAVGAMSDALRPILGQESLRYALLVMCPGYIWGGWQLWQGSRTVLQDAELASRDTDYWGTRSVSP